MSESKFTPGPWQKLGSAEDDECRVRQTASVRESDGFIVEKTICTNVRSDADAKLIAAAPDLLEAINGMLLHIREPESEAEFQWPDHFKRQKDAFIAARSAIRKATA